jgi:hypothetical protein
VLLNGTYGVQANASQGHHFAGLYRNASMNGAFYLLTEQFEGSILNLTTNPRPPICDYCDSNYPRVSNKTITRRTPLCFTVSESDGAVRSKE